MGNIGLPYKSGLGSCLQQGYRGSNFNENNLLTGDTAVHFQPYGIRISGVNQTILPNEPFIFTYRIYFDGIFGSTGGGGIVKGFSIYCGDMQIQLPGKAGLNPSATTLEISQTNDSILVFSLINIGLGFAYTLTTTSFFSGSDGVLKRRTPYNITLYKAEGPLTSTTPFRLYINGKNVSFIPTTYTGTRPSVLSALTFNVINFGANNFLGNYGGTEPNKIFNNSVFKVDTGLTTTYIDNLALELHRVDNYIHLLPTSYTINPSNVAYYFPLYIKEGKDIRDYYKPTKKFYVRLGFGSNIFFNDVDFTNGTSLVNTPTANGTLTFTSKTASIYKGPHNIWRKAYPPYDPYI